MDVVPVLDRPMTKILWWVRVGGWRSLEVRRVRAERRKGIMNHLRSLRLIVEMERPA